MSCHLPSFIAHYQVYAHHMKVGNVMQRLHYHGRRFLFVSQTKTDVLFYHHTFMQESAGVLVHGQYQANRYTVMELPHTLKKQAMVRAFDPLTVQLQLRCNLVPGRVLHFTVLGKPATFHVMGVKHSYEVVRLNGQLKTVWWFAKPTPHLLLASETWKQGRPVARSVLQPGEKSTG